MNIVALVVALVAVGMTAFIFNEAEATYTRTVGTMTVSMNPNAGASGNEFVTISFSGIFGKPGYADFTGWSIKSGSEVIYDMSEILLHSTETIKICEDKIDEPSCDYVWSGSDTLPDADGVVSIVSPEGIEEVIVNYGSVAVGQVLYENGDYVAEVNQSKDKITICQEKQNGSYEAKSIPVNNLINELEKGLDGNSMEIIPAFIYETKKTPGYHPGLNWPEERDTLANNCQ